MIYLNPEALVTMKRDLAAWYDRAVAVAQSGTPPVTPTVAASEGPATGPN